MESSNKSSASGGGHGDGSGQRKQGEGVCGSESSGHKKLTKLERLEMAYAEWMGIYHREMLISAYYKHLSRDEGYYSDKDE